MNDEMRQQLKALRQLHDQGLLSEAAYQTAVATLQAESEQENQKSGNTTVGERGVNIGGNVGGSVITGDGNVIHMNTPQLDPASLPSHLAPLRDQIIRLFSKSELKSLCFDLGIAHDDLPSDTRSELAQAIVSYCHTRDRLPELVALCQRHRPHASWQY